MTEDRRIIESVLCGASVVAALGMLLGITIRSALGTTLTGTLAAVLLCAGAIRLLYLVPDDG